MEHGKRYAYERGGCRCEACRAWYNERARAYRRRRMARDGTRMVRGRFVGREEEAQHDA